MNRRTRIAPADLVAILRRRGSAAAAGAMLTCLAAATAHAQELVNANYRNSDILSVIEAVGQITGRTIVVDPRVRAQVSLYSTEPMSADEFYQAFLQMLEVYSYAAIEIDGITRIIPDANVRQVPGAEPGGVGAELVTTTIALEHVNATQLVPALRPMVPTYAQMAAHPSSNVLILTDRASNIDRIVSIVRRIDEMGAEDVDFIRLEYASAGDVVQKLSTLAQASTAVGNVAPIQAIADERTNSVLLSGPQSARLRYSSYVMMLDTPTEGSGDTVVRYLNYADAEDLAGKLQTQFGGVVAAEGAEAGVPPNAEVSIWFDGGTNALVLSGPAPILQSIQTIIDQIDIPRAQVLVEAIIVEVGEEKAAELGITWLTDGSSDDEIVGLTNFGGSTGGIINLATVGQGGTPNPAAIPDGITAAIGRIRDTGTSWAAVIQALRGDATTNIISTPTILTLDNEEAEIRVGQEVPFLTGQFTNTGANQGSVNPFQTIQREEVGTRLKITPQINEGSGVKLTIEQETSSISAGAAGAVDIVTNNRTITTSVFVNDGDVLVLGGLIDDELRQSEQRVPGLGKIPGLGWLFRARTTDRIKTNLMVFIRPRILRDSVDARFQTTSKYRYIRDLQRLEAEERVRLMREESHPVLPELPPLDTSDDAPAADDGAGVGTGTGAGGRVDRERPAASDDSAPAAADDSAPAAGDDAASGERRRGASRRSPTRN